MPLQFAGGYVLRCVERRGSGLVSEYILNRARRLSGYSFAQSCSRAHLAKRLGNCQPQLDLIVDNVLPKDAFLGGESVAAFEALPTAAEVTLRRSGIDHCAAVVATIRTRHASAAATFEPCGVFFPAEFLGVDWITHGQNGSTTQAMNARRLVLSTSINC